MPCCVLSCFSCLLFLLPPDSGIEIFFYLSFNLGLMLNLCLQIGEKISLGITVLLALFVNLLVVSEYTPEAATELPVLGL